MNRRNDRMAEAFWLGIYDDVLLGKESTTTVHITDHNKTSTLACLTNLVCAWRIRGSVINCSGPKTLVLVVIPSSPLKANRGGYMKGISDHPTGKSKRGLVWPDNVSEELCAMRGGS